MKAVISTPVLRATLAVAFAAFAFACSRPDPGKFKDPAEAAKAVHALVGAKDAKKVEAVFGPGTMDMFLSGDEVADQADYASVKKLIEEKVSSEDVDETTKVLLFGNSEWPFPVPLTKEGEIWRFDSVKGREEIANRLVGRNELFTMATLRAVVDAQREYAAAGHDGLPPQYARRFHSSEGKHDGLSWKAAEAEPESPLGELVAAASAKGYSTENAGAEPYNGYFFRLLESQGKSAPGGERSYVDAAGNMTGGFACLAWPAKHGMSGVMTLMVSDRGLVFEKDLGEGTEAAVAAITTYDPDDSWTPTWDPDDVPEMVAESPAPQETPAEAPATGAPTATGSKG